MQLHSPCKTLSTSKGLVKWSLPGPSPNPTMMSVVIVQTGPEPGLLVVLSIWMLFFIWILLFRQDLNLGFVMGQHYKLQNKVDDLSTKVHVRTLHDISAYIWLCVHLSMRIYYLYIRLFFYRFVNLTSLFLIFKQFNLML